MPSAGDEGNAGKGGGPPGVTISEVASVAGVSRQTVSNVLNAPERVAPETAARVRRAIERLGYRPNRAARNLRERASRCIGFRINSPCGVSNFLDRFLHTLVEAAGSAGYHVLLFTSADVAAELADYNDLIRSGTVDGFVLADVSPGDRRLRWLAGRGIAFVCFGRPWGQEGGGFTWVDVDGTYGLGQAVDFLVSHGHRRIAYLGWPEGTGFGNERRNGWRAAMERNGLDTTDLEAVSAEEVGAAAEAAGRLLALSDPPTAFACGSDTYAVGARFAAGTDARGRPGVGVVGFDDSPAATLMSPPLSSVRQPLAEVARRIVDLLVSRIQDSDAPAEGVLLPPELVVRDRPAPRVR